MLNVKEIASATRVAAGEVLVIVPERPMTAEAYVKVSQELNAVGVHVLILPAGTKVYVKEQS